MPIMPPSTVATSPRLGDEPAWALCLPSKVPFPPKLCGMLQFAEQMDLTHIVSWLPHGRAFKIHDPEKFMSQIASKFFRAKKVRSIHRQLLIWGFQRNDEGEDKDAWFHKSFLRGRPELMKSMLRRKFRGQDFIKHKPVTHAHMSLLCGEFERAQKTPAQPRRVTFSQELADANGPGFSTTFQQVPGKEIDQSQHGTEDDESLLQIFGSDFRDSLLQVPGRDFNQVLLEIIYGGSVGPGGAALIS